MAAEKRAERAAMSDDERRFFYRHRWKSELRRRAAMSDRERRAFNLMRRWRARARTARARVDEGA